jgi:[ribosomal protein S5]-alanine N-acetyltransferase
MPHQGSAWNATCGAASCCVACLVTATQNLPFPFAAKADRLLVMTTLKSMTALETPHLILREIVRSDAEELSAFMTQPRYHRHIAHRLRDGAMVKDFVRRQIAAQNDNRRQIFHLAAEEKFSTDVVGEGFLIAHGDGSHEAGWGVHPAMWSMGMGTEIGQALLGVAFEHLKASRVWCKVMTANTASAKLARRIGMALVTSHETYALGNGRVGAVDIYALSATDYFDLPY